MKASSLFRMIVCLIIALLSGCAPQPIEITSFPSTFNLNNMTIELSGYRLGKYDLAIDICFSSPSQETWLFDDVVLEIDNQVITEEVARQSTVTEIVSDGFACGSIMYRSDWSEVSTGKAVLSIGKLRTHVQFEDWDCAKAQRNLDAAETGIVISCDPAIVGRDTGFVVIKKPLSLKGEDAVLIAMKAFSDSIQTNWKFAFDIEKP